VRASTCSPRACSGDMYATVPIAMPGVVKASGSKEPLGVSCGDTPSPGPLRSPGAWTRGSPALSHVEGHPLPQGGEGCWLGKVSPNRNQNLGLLAHRNENVRRLDVAVRDPFGVCCIQRVGYLNGGIERFTDRRRATPLLNRP